MTRTRLVVVHAAIALVLGGHALTMALDPSAEAWPFSQYPMYSRRSAVFPRLGQRRLFAIAADDPAREFPLVDAAFLAPLDVEYISAGFTRILGVGDDARLRDALANCTHRYEVRRRAGLHRGPPIAGVRLYRLLWHVEADRANVDRPDTMRLLAEYREP